ncbi:alpha/beta hydrolase [Alcaligenaceae bacterium]|nr:alpha/beta hydrolase [Alcaligenaceae bacterium]
MAYWEWGDPDNDKVLLCVHGLTRTGRDFDRLATRLASDYRVICPDIVGRGQSDWLINPTFYVVPQYVSDVLTLIARLNPRQLDWVGTSMGGLIGLALAGTLAMSAQLQPRPEQAGMPKSETLRLGKIILNDIGPSLSLSGLERIGTYVGQPMSFDSFGQATDYVRSISTGFGEHDQQGWEALTQHVFTEQDGKWIKNYDLRIAEPFAGQSAEIVKASEALLWSAYESISSPVLVVRGESSDLLTAETAKQMLARNTHAGLHVVPNVGHAPTLRTDDQIDPIRNFLLA